jgi:uncharacterized membrane protein YphA (DoxX/SURF4 family)
MNIILWILQILMAAQFIWHGYILVAPPAELVEIMNANLGVGFRIFLGTAEILVGIGLIAPGLTRILPWLVSVTAACMTFVAGSAIVYHLIRNEIESAVYTTVLFVILAFLTYARWKMKPIPPQRNAAAGR